MTAASTNSANVLAAIAGKGAGNASLAFFAPPATALPTAYATALNAAFVDPGYCTSDGLTEAFSEDTTEIAAYGTLSVVRTIVTKSTLTFGLGFLETNTISVSIYHRKPLTGTGSITATTGLFSAAVKGSDAAHYSAVFELVDPEKAAGIRIVVPDLAVTAKGDRQWQLGNSVPLTVTCTAYPDSSGNVAYEYYSVPSA